MSEDILPTPIFEPDLELEWALGPETEIVFSPVSIHVRFTPEGDE